MLTISRCDQCGQQDDHPKVHVAFGGTFHHDCLSADLHAELSAHPIVGQIIAAAQGGMHGDDLRDHIHSLHQEG